MFSDCIFNFTSSFFVFMGLQVLLINFEVILMYTKTTINTKNLETDLNSVSGEENPSSDIVLLKGMRYFILRNKQIYTWFQYKISYSLKKELIHDS